MEYVRRLSRQLADTTPEREMVLDPKTTGLHSDYGSFDKSAGPSAADTENNNNNKNHDVEAAAASATGGADGPPNGEIMAQSSDMYQRQPLLTSNNNANGATDNWIGISTNSDYDDEEIVRADGTYHHRDRGNLGNGGPGSENGIIKIDLPYPDEPRFPKEKWKTFTAFLFMSLNFLFTCISLAMVHDRVPDRSTYTPLPDIVLDNVTVVDGDLNVSEYLIVTVSSLAMVFVIFHKHRFIIMRRIFLMVGLLYMMRSITMYVTVLPVASTTYFCSPKSNSTTPLVIAKRVLQLISGFGLSINGKHTFCGDYIYSGHTVILVMSYLIIKEYSPKKFRPLHWLVAIAAVVGIVMVLRSRGHYSVDVLIAYYVTTRIWYMYHTMANNAQLKTKGPNNYLARLWWFPIFRHFEINVKGTIPRRYNWPLPWPRTRFFVKHPTRNS